MVATFSSQLRIMIFRKKHNNSYFRKHRQNIATMDQLLVASYLTLITALFKEAIVLTIILNYHSNNEFEEFWSI